MPGEQTVEAEAAILILREKALASKVEAEAAQAALLAADPNNSFHEPEPAPGAGRGHGPPITQASLELMLAKAVESSTSMFKDSILAVTRENSAIKASQIRLEAQRTRMNNLGKTEGKTVSLAKQLDFTEDTIAALDDMKALALGIILDKPVGPVPPAGPASPSQSVCKLADCRDGSLLLEQLDALNLSVKAKLKELTIVWGAPSYRVAFEAIGADAHLQGAVAEEAFKEIEQAVTRVDTLNKAKRKDDAAIWGTSKQSRQSGPGGWGKQEYQAPQQGQGNWSNNQDWQASNQARSSGNKGGGKGRPQPPSGHPPASYSGDASPNHSGNRPVREGRPGPNQCAYCWAEGHHKHQCAELAEMNRKWQAANSGW